MRPTGVPFLAVDYRLAPESPGTITIQDAFAAVAWLFDHADKLGVDPTRIAIMADSGSGGVGNGAAILARDIRLLLARQIPIYPMLDDRNPHRTPYSHPPRSGRTTTTTRVGTPCSVTISARPLYRRLQRRPVLRTSATSHRLSSRSGNRTSSAMSPSNIPGACCRPASRANYTSCRVRPMLTTLIGMQSPIGRRSLDEKVRVISSV